MFFNKFFLAHPCFLEKIQQQKLRTFQGLNCPSLKKQYSNFLKTNRFLNKESMTPLVKNSKIPLDKIVDIKKHFSPDFSSDKPAFLSYENSNLRVISYGIFTMTKVFNLSCWLFTPTLQWSSKEARWGLHFCFS